MDIIYTTIASTLAATISAFFSWFFTRKKYNSEVDNSNINNMQESLDFYVKVYQKDQEILEKLQKQIDNMQIKIDDLMSTNSNQQRQINDLNNQIVHLLGQICLNFSCNSRIQSE